MRDRRFPLRAAFGPAGAALTLAAAVGALVVARPAALRAQEVAPGRRAVHLGGGLALGALPGPLVGSCDSFSSGNGSAGAVASVTAGVALSERLTIEGETAFAAAAPFGCDAAIRTRTRPLGGDLLEVRTPGGFGFDGGAYWTTGARAVLAAPAAWRAPHLRAALGAGMAWPMGRPYVTLGAGLGTRGRGARVRLDLEYGMVPVSRRERVEIVRAAPGLTPWTLLEGRTATHLELARWTLLRLSGSVPLRRVP